MNNIGIGRNLTEDELSEAIKALVNELAAIDGLTITIFDPLALQEPSIHSALDAIHNGRKRGPIEWPS